MEDISNDPAILEVAEGWWKYLSTHLKGFSAHTLGNQLKVVKANKGNVICEMIVDETSVNGYGALHGGQIANIIDIVGSLAIIAAGHQTSGVSTDISVSYFSHAPLNSKLILHGKALKLGKSLGFAQVDLYLSETKAGKEDTKLIASGRHTKFLGIADRVQKGKSKSKL
ncbi:HotDog domain-containing protein [Paraphysoderma sedebokerense]|nr:HotDog domain-containing protein [Paraphysoderma sedebokerense]